MANRINKANNDPAELFDCGGEKLNTKGMLVPVRCSHCGKVYDLTKGKPVDRYSDCTVFITPCCNKRVDDRTYKGCPDIIRL